MSHGTIGYQVSSKHHPRLPVQAIQLPMLTWELTLPMLLLSSIPGRCFNQDLRQVVMQIQMFQLICCQCINRTDIRKIHSTQQLLLGRPADDQMKMTTFDDHHTHNVHSKYNANT